MAEETRNPQKTVPRVMYTTVIFNFIFSYVLAVVYIFGAAPYAKGLLGISPVVST
jgi:amino acid transporter